jgi:predicted metal-dependent HD superfamily phosphohydrolase
LFAAGHRRVVGHLLRRGPLDRRLIEAALLLGDGLLLARCDGLPSLEGLDLTPAERRRIHPVRVPRLPTGTPPDAALEILALKNLGASTVLLDPAAFVSPSEPCAHEAVRHALARWSRAALGVDVVVLPSEERDARCFLALASPLPLSDALLAEVAATYGKGRRAYHTFGHAADVVRALASARHAVGAVPSPEAFMAALFHDAVYDAGRRDSEARSAELARAALARHLPQANIDVDRVEALILLTARHGALGPGDVDDEAAAFLDADLAVLAAGEATFDRYDEGVAYEYGLAVAPEAFREGRRTFLAGLLQKERLFLSEEAHARLDAGARRNLARAVARLASSAGAPELSASG